MVGSNTIIASPMYDDNFTAWMERRERSSDLPYELYGKRSSPEASPHGLALHDRTTIQGHLKEAMDRLARAVVTHTDRPPRRAPSYLYGELRLGKLVLIC